MFKLTQLIDFAAGADRAPALAALADAGKAKQVVQAACLPTHEGVYNGGHLIWHVQFADEPSWRQWTREQKGRLGELPGVIHIEHAAYQAGPLRITRPGLANGVYRVALFCAKHNVTPERVAQYDRETMEMGHYIKKIRNWQCSRVLEASGNRPWTHVWEQEYDDISGLQGAYMLHPHHWAHIDRWYDPECTDWLIDPYLCHTYADLPASVMTPKA